MERNYQVANPKNIDPYELHCRTAYHEAGHAAAIHIRNRQKQLPPVFFEIQVKRPHASEMDFFAKVIDGNLIQNLPIAVIESFSMVTDSGQHSCQRAYEADIVNLLVGPLAEAKYVSLCDDEIFNLQLMNLNALSHYGGHSDLESVQHYLEYFITSRHHREKKLKELLSQAYQFIDNPKHWDCIRSLAHFILESGDEVISCDDAICIFDTCLAARKSNTWKRSVTFAGR
ncbi:MAG: hypothetical protein CTY19_04635 [Methylomonas sp.]|jgi:hypothetical protein|nr:MAG: hypothetical protein CTY19_04635 [Methylomonas sp.]